HILSYQLEPPEDPPPRPPRPALVITHCADGRRCRRSPRRPPPPTPLSPSPPPALGTLSPPRGHRRSASCGSTFPPQNLGGGHGGGFGAPPPECRIIRVRMDLRDGSLYKSILITSQDKTPTVVAKALEKHGQDTTAAPHFQLIQLLPQNRELFLPPSANVFYAMAGASLDFILRPSKDLAGGGGSTEPPPLKKFGGGGESHRAATLRQ
ncbi:ral guanine nucleotide dissociation stimulator-like 2, partial [Pterocles gutturalis]